MGQTPPIQLEEKSPPSSRRCSFHQHSLRFFFFIFIYKESKRAAPCGKGPANGATGALSRAARSGGVRPLPPMPRTSRWLQLWRDGLSKALKHTLKFQHARSCPPANKALKHGKQRRLWQGIEIKHGLVNLAMMLSFWSFSPA